MAPSWGERVLSCTTNSTPPESRGAAVLRPGVASGDQAPVGAADTHKCAASYPTWKRSRDQARCMGDRSIRSVADIQGRARVLRPVTYSRARRAPRPSAMPRPSPRLAPAITATGRRDPAPVSLEWRAVQSVTRSRTAMMRAASFRSTRPGASSSGELRWRRRRSAGARPCCIRRASEPDRPFAASPPPSSGSAWRLGCRVRALGRVEWGRMCCGRLDAAPADRDQDATRGGAAGGRDGRGASPTSGGRDGRPRGCARPGRAAGREAHRSRRNRARSEGFPPRPLSLR